MFSRYVLILSVLISCKSTDKHVDIYPNYERPSNLAGQVKLSIEVVPDNSFFYEVYVDSKSYGRDLSLDEYEFAANTRHELVVEGFSKDGTKLYTSRACRENQGSYLLDQNRNKVRLSLCPVLDEGQRKSSE